MRSFINLARVSDNISFLNFFGRKAFASLRIPTQNSVITKDLSELVVVSAFFTFRPEAS